MSIDTIDVEEVNAAIYGSATYVELEMSIPDIVVISSDSTLKGVAGSELELHFSDEKCDLSADELLETM